MMKKKLIFMFAVLGVLGSFTACSDDDKKDSPLFETKSYEGDKLNLTYSELPLDGKAVTFSTTDGNTATLTMTGGSFSLDMISGLLSSTKTSPTEATSLLPGVIPGQKITTISDIQLTKSGDSYVFNGESTVEGVSIKYQGTAYADSLKLALNVTIPANPLIGSWNLAPLVLRDDWSGYDSEPLYLCWESPDSFKIEMAPNFAIPFAAGDILKLSANIPVKDNKSAQQLLLDVLRTVSFQADGNIVAMYSDYKGTAAPEWTASPVNIAQYAVKDSTISLILNPVTILAAVTAKGTKADVPMESMIAAFTKLMPMLSTGIPLTYHIEGSNLRVYAGTELMMEILSAALPILQDKEFIASLIEDLKKDPNMGAMAPMLEGMLAQIPQILATTTKMGLGLNFVK